MSLSKRAGVAIVALTGVTRVNSLFTLWGGDIADLLGRTGIEPGVQDVVLTMGVVMLVLASTLMLLSEKTLASRWGIRLVDADDLSLRRATSESRRRSPNTATPCRPPATSVPREDEIVRLIARGKTNPEIERELFIAPGTLKAHIQHIYVKCSVHSRKELLQLCGGE